MQLLADRKESFLKEPPTDFVIGVVTRTRNANRPYNPNRRALFAHSYHHWQMCRRGSGGQRKCCAWPFFWCTTGHTEGAISTVVTACRRNSREVLSNGDLDINIVCTTFQNDRSVRSWHCGELPAARRTRHQMPTGSVEQKGKHAKFSLRTEILKEKWHSESHQLWRAPRERRSWSWCDLGVIQ